MEEEVLPQRPNARRRIREQLQPDQCVSERLSYDKANEHLPALEAGSARADGTCLGPPQTKGYKSSNEEPAPGTAGEDPDVTPGDAAGPDGSQRGADSGALPEYRSAAVGKYKFEYLDHTADVQLHAWGHDLTEAFENCALAMYNYMSPLKLVRKRETRTFRAEGHDLPSLLFAFLDELLFVFATELFLAASLTITSIDRTAFVIEAEGCGETFDRAVHEVGTEVKAITYSAMSILERDGDAEVFVIVDI